MCDIPFISCIVYSIFTRLLEPPLDMTLSACDVERFKGTLEGDDDAESEAEV
jgi:hypothetical protein